MMKKKSFTQNNNSVSKYFRLFTLNLEEQKQRKEEEEAKKVVWGKIVNNEFQSISVQT